MKFSRRTRGRLSHLALHLLLLPGALSMAIPFIWMVSTAFKNGAEIFTFPPTLIGETVTFDNFHFLFERVPFAQYFLNSIKVAVIVTAGSLFTSALAGYTFGRLNFRGRDKIFLLYLATLMVPGHVTLIPNFITMGAFSLVDTHWSLILPGLASAFGTFLIRQFVVTIPKELDEAAKIDGCTPFGIFMRISLPLIKPALTTLAIFTFNGVWTDYLSPLIYINSPVNRTLTVGIASLQGTYATDWGMLMAGLTVSMLPMLIVFLCAQDLFVKGIVMTGMKA